MGDLPPSPVPTEEDFAAHHVAPSLHLNSGNHSAVCPPNTTSKPIDGHLPAYRIIMASGVHRAGRHNSVRLPMNARMTNNFQLQPGERKLLEAVDCKGVVRKVYLTRYSGNHSLHCTLEGMADYITAYELARDAVVALSRDDSQNPTVAPCYYIEHDTTEANAFLADPANQPLKSEEGAQKAKTKKHKPAKLPEDRTALIAKRLTAGEATSQKTICLPKEAAMAAFPSLQRQQQGKLIVKDCYGKSWGVIVMRHQSDRFSLLGTAFLQKHALKTGDVMVLTRDSQGQRYLEANPPSHVLAGLNILEDRDAAARVGDETVQCENNDNSYHGNGSGAPPREIASPRDGTLAGGGRREVMQVYVQRIVEDHRGGMGMKVPDGYVVEQQQESKGVDRQEHRVHGERAKEGDQDHACIQQDPGGSSAKEKTHENFKGDTSENNEEKEQENGEGEEDHHDHVHHQHHHHHPADADGNTTKDRFILISKRLCRSEAEIDNLSRSRGIRLPSAAARQMFPLDYGEEMEIHAQDCHEKVWSLRVLRMSTDAYMLYGVTDFIRERRMQVGDTLALLLDAEGTLRIENHPRQMVPDNENVDVGAAAAQCAVGAVSFEVNDEVAMRVESSREDHQLTENDDAARKVPALPRMVCGIGDHSNFPGVAAAAGTTTGGGGGADATGSPMPLQRVFSSTIPNAAERDEEQPLQLAIETPLIVEERATKSKRDADSFNGRPEERPKGCPNAVHSSKRARKDLNSIFSDDTESLGDDGPEQGEGGSQRRIVALSRKVEILTKMLKDVRAENASLTVENDSMLQQAIDVEAELASIKCSLQDHVATAVRRREEDSIRLRKAQEQVTTLKRKVGHLTGEQIAMKVQVETAREEALEFCRSRDELASQLASTRAQLVVLREVAGVDTLTQEIAAAAAEAAAKAAVDALRMGLGKQMTKLY